VIEFDDDVLMSGIAAGDGAAFGVLVIRYSPTIYRIGRRMLGNHHDAEEVVQECFSRLWQRSADWESRGAGLIGWLHRTATNLCFDRHRRQRAVPAELASEIDEAESTDDRITSEKIHAVLAGAVADLPERYRTALALCYFEGLSNAVAAQTLGINVKALESILFRARRQLRRTLEQKRLTAGDVFSGETRCVA